MTPRVAVAAVVFDDHGRVLVIERARPPNVGLWSVPGGKVGPGETLAQAVAREVREETGLTVEIGTLVCVVEVIEHAAEIHYVILDYAARVIGGTLTPGGDARAARFVDDAELAQLPVTDGLVNVVARARATQPPWSTSR